MPTKAKEADPADKLTEEEYNEIANHNVMLGKLTALENVANELRQNGEQAFGRHKDDHAKWFRLLSDRYQVRHDDLRKEFDTKYHPEFLKT